MALLSTEEGLSTVETSRIRAVRGPVVAGPVAGVGPGDLRGSRSIESFDRFLPYLLGRGSRLSAGPDIHCRQVRDADRGGPVDELGRHRYGHGDRVNREHQLREACRPATGYRDRNCDLDPGVGPILPNPAGHDHVGTAYAIVFNTGSDIHSAPPTLIQGPSHGPMTAGGLATVQQALRSPTGRSSAPPRPSSRPVSAPPSPRPR